MQDPRAQKEIERDGVFRAYPIAWTLEEPSKKPDKDTGQPSQSQPIVFQFAIYQEWGKDAAGNGAWSDPWPEGYFVFGRSYVITKVGEVNEGAVKALAEAGLWNGDVDEIAGPVRNVYVLITVERNDYNGKVSYRVAWINPNADVPPERTGFKPVDPSVLALTRQRFGQKMKAVAGGTKGGRPPTPPAQPAAPVAPPGPRLPAGPPAQGTQPLQQQPAARPNGPSPLGPPRMAPSSPPQPVAPPRPAGPPPMGAPQFQPPPQPQPVQQVVGDVADDRVPWEH